LVGKSEGTRPIWWHRHRWKEDIKMVLNPLNAELNSICHLLALLGAHHILHISWIRVKSIGREGLNWINLTHDRDKRRAIAHIVMQLLSQHSFVTCFLCHGYHTTYSLLLPSA
jgi:hypothetical protein